MEGIKNQELMTDQRVKQEIERHRWLESEKAGRDIGYEQAARDWMTRYSDGWMKVNMPKPRSSGRSARRI